jgi:hypothetical protein
VRQTFDLRVCHAAGSVVEGTLNRQGKDNEPSEHDRTSRKVQGNQLKGNHMYMSGKMNAAGTVAMKKKQGTW